MVGERATARQDGGGAGCVREVVGGMVRAGRVPASLLLAHGETCMLRWGLPYHSPLCVRAVGWTVGAQALAKACSINPWVV